MNAHPTPRLSGTALTGIATVLAAIGAGLLAMSAPASPTHPAAVSQTAADEPPTVTQNPTVTTPAPSAVRLTGQSRSPQASPARQHAVSTSAPGTGSALPPPGAEPEADPLVQHGLDQARVEGLTPATARHLVALAKAIWTADVTGAGRDRWPGYFTDPVPQAVYTRFRIQAAVADRDTARPKAAVVRLVWAGADPAGTFLDGRTATIRLTKKGASWTPVR
ncbi:hypothetical protein [Actinacidiphila glaucinigra]|uniref:Uncharacterized protein n=1 Tax=Actinacidiphila glaucinigra TaxID=235986 RepID=A0A239LRD2_9ACTN|nr:hypothetical protein [Actinacidiphila glaucinigra]SNT33106.1 hypothetical protein SAMN05216252_12122 [Actinacidiphila glaucinigra]